MATDLQGVVATFLQRYDAKPYDLLAKGQSPTGSVCWYCPRSSDRKSTGAPARSSVTTPRKGARAAWG